MAILPKGTYQVGNLTISVDDKGNISGGWEGKIDTDGTIRDTKGRYIGSIRQVGTGLQYVYDPTNSGAYSQSAQTAPVVPIGNTPPIQLPFSIAGIYSDGYNTIHIDTNGSVSGTFYNQPIRGEATPEGVTFWPVGGGIVRRFTLKNGKLVDTLPGAYNTGISLNKTGEVPSAAPPPTGPAPGSPLPPTGPAPGTTQPPTAGAPLGPMPQTQTSLVPTGRSAFVPAGQWQFGNLNLNIDLNGNISGDWSGRIQPDGTVVDQQGNRVGAVQRDPNTGQYIFRDQNGNTAPGTPITVTPGQNLLTGVSSPEFDYTIQLLNNLRDATTQEYLSSLEDVRAIGNLISGNRNQAIADLANVFNTVRTGFWPKGAEILQQVYDAVNAYTGSLPQLRQQLESASTEIGGPLKQRILDALDQLTQAQQPYNAAVERFSQAVPRYQQGLEAAAARIGALPREQIEPSLERYVSAIPGIAQQIQQLQGANLPVVGEVSNRLLGALRGDISLPILLQRDLQQREQALRENLMRELGPGYATSTPGVQALMEFNRLREGLVEEFRRNEINNLLQGLAGTTMTSSNLATQALGVAGEEFRARTTGAQEIARLLGIEQAMRQEVLNAQMQELGARQQQLATTANIAEAQRAGAGDVAKLLGLSTAMREQAGGTFLQEAEARRQQFGTTAQAMDALLGSQANMINLANAMQGFLLGPTSARLALSQSAIENLSRAALLPMQARGTALGLLQAAIGQPADTASLLQTLAQTVSNIRGSNLGIAQTISGIQAVTNPLAQGIAAGFGQLAGGLQRYGELQALMSLFNQNRTTPSTATTGNTYIPSSFANQTSSAFNSMLSSLFQ